MPADGNHTATPAIDDLPRLTDDEREDLDSGYIAMQGVPSMAPISNALVPADFRDAMLSFLRDVRADIDRAQCVTACGVGALHHLNMSETEDIATTLQEYVDNQLYEQVQKLDTMIQCMEVQEVYRG